MDFCHFDHQNASLSAELVILFKPHPGSYSGSWTCSSVPQTSECSWIAIPIGHTPLSWYERTVTVFCIVFKLYILLLSNICIMFYPNKTQKKHWYTEHECHNYTKNITKHCLGWATKWSLFQRISNLEKKIKREGKNLQRRKCFGGFVNSQTSLHNSLQSLKQHVARVG